MNIKSFCRRLESFTLESLECIEELNKEHLAFLEKQDFEQAELKLKQIEGVTAALKSARDARHMFEVPIKRKKIQFTPGNVYDAHICTVLLNMGGKGTLTDVQEKIYKLLASTFLPADRICAPGSNRPRWKALSASRVSMLVLRGVIRKEGNLLFLV